MTQLNEQDYKIGLLGVLGRIAGALEAHNALLFAAQPDRPAPNLQRKLEDYAGFDWDTIGAHIEAFDRHGATEVTWNGKLFKRYRSAEDDDKGQDIRFRRVASGTVAEKNLKWESLIKFGSNRKPAKPLRGDLADKIEHAKPSDPPASSPLPALGEGLGACHPLGVVGVTTPTETQQRKPELPTELRRDWLHWHDQAAKFGSVPAELGLYDVDTIASVKDKIAALVKLYESNVTATINAACDQLAALLAEAKQAGIDVPAEFFDLDHATLDVIELRIGTVKNLLAAKHGEQVTTQPATQQPITNIAGQQIIARLQDMAAKSAQRTMSQSMSFDTVSALEHIAGSEPMRHAFCQRVFGIAKFADLKDPQRYALFSWLKPARASGSKAQPTNPKASSELAAVMATPEVP